MMLKPGDIVKVTERWGAAALPLYPQWGSKALGMPISYTALKPSHLAFVLQSLEDQGGNGAQIVTSDGIVGWVNVHYLEVIA